jgi:hypothetical protein
LDYGTPTVTATHTVTESANNSPNPNLGSPTSGSLKLAWTFNTATDTDGAAAFTMDIFHSNQTFTSISFDMYVDPTSTPDASSNAGYTEYGYFQIFTRDQSNSYQENEVKGGPDSSGLGATPGTDPVTGLPDATFGTGVWEHFTVKLIGAAQNLSGLTFQDFSNGTNGPDAIYLDNITLNAVPEPASLGLLAVAGSSMLMRRRRRA